ncbi:alpha/beta hydrolase [Riemerella anatipestifer]|uniref:Alpha/beta hydrolase n=2 Tax=Riemerella anatipestifer TaxID=34085 RepID=E4TBN3_RIEAD|nr:alpha/beta hydrolase [Riemerella anatipestifer]ADQ81862.1 hypothetical protein Riean_0698 [Riemerella anatipestifer ATCC 11845 = DSM 15868]ADZ12637.1 hypothetical protein RIA_1548 [Riemerella anatipestifer RA-GD]AFD55871.1 hypothetical protein RA0C_0935 [Riemerella anatipestifer ATCC 11845 = DSM 15868]AGC40224.1 hypothetical protein G148_0920 [Riemerella anatipestifer RA-CH-2]AKP69099.1 hypothetical protein CG08_0777 [Riemerella anatipestifer]
MSKIYIFSGLGADKRAFEKIDFSNYDYEFIDWIEPKDRESLEDYAFRISEKIITEKPVLIGLSFGGIVATEVAKHIAIEKVILIASAKTKFEIPKLYRWFGKLKIDRLISERFLRYPNVLLYWVFGVENNSDKILLSEIIKDTNPKFLKWAIREILHWRNVQVGDNTIHIHGTKDRILPYRNIDSPIKVNNGGHFMIINKSELLTQILKVEINKNLEV